MTTIDHDLPASCTPAALWSVLSDLTAVAEYNPTVKAVRIVGIVPDGVGAMRECDLHPAGCVVERVTVFEPGAALGLEVVQSDWPVSAMSWVTRIEPAGDGSRLTQRLEYRMKFGPVGWLLNALVMRRNITRNVGEALEGLIRKAEAAA